MKTYVSFAALLILSPILMGSSCRGLGTGSQNPCDGVACTMMFAMIAAEVKDASGTPAKLDQVYTIREKNSARINLDQNMDVGKYVVLDDSYLKTIANSTESFRFVGFKNNIQVVNEPYVISADCCHVRKEQGKNVISLK